MKLFCKRAYDSSDHLGLTLKFQWHYKLIKIQMLSTDLMNIILDLFWIWGIFLIAVIQWNVQIELYTLNFFDWYSFIAWDVV